MRPEVKDHVYSAMRRAPLVLEPFPHFHVKGVFPADFYRQLVARLPADQDYETYPAPYEERRFIQMNRSTAGKLSGGAAEFWQPFEAWLHSQEFLDRMTEKFAPQLHVNRPHRTRQLEKHAADGQVHIGPRSLLVRDYANFALGPHTDSGSKFIVGAFYFPRDEQLKEFGTSLYTPRQQGQVAWDSPHLDHADFKLDRTIPNLPNSMFVFMKTDNSWHGVENKPHANVGRDVLFWIPQIGPAPGAEHQLALPRALFEDAPPPSLWRRLTGR
jgi:hypothetical protein